jgi:hypothetical protein
LPGLGLPNIDENEWPLPGLGRPRPKHIDESDVARPLNIDENKRPLPGLGRPLPQHIDENKWPLPGLGRPRPKHIDESDVARPLNIDENEWPLPGLGRPLPKHIDENKMARPMQRMRKRTNHPLRLRCQTAGHNGHRHTQRRSRTVSSRRLVMPAGWLHEHPSNQ